MRIEGSVRANIRAAIASAKRLRGRPVHKDTIEYWRQLLDYSRVVSLQSSGEAVTDLIAELEAELASVKVA